MGRENLNSMHLSFLTDWTDGDIDSGDSEKLFLPGFFLYVFFWYGSFVKSLRHRVKLLLRFLFASRPKWRILTYRRGNTCRRNRLINSSVFRVIVFCRLPSA